LHIHQNDEVILPSFTSSTVLEPILIREIIPKLVDINFDCSLNIKQVVKKQSQKNKARVVTHFFGIPANMAEIKKIAEFHGLYITED
jgi:dTDP-4-amino-4,6-dideoxygalactose transaminase